MRRVLLAVLLGWCAGAGAAQDAGKYADNGVTFDYPKGWKAKTEKMGPVVGITVQNDKGTQAVIQVHTPEADPKTVREVMLGGLKKAFEGKVVAGSEKAAKKKFAGAERGGTAMDVEVAKGVNIHVELYAFPLAAKKPVVLVMFQHAAFDAADAGKGFDQIAGSLAADGPAAKSPPEPKKAPEPVAKSIVTINPPAPGGWGFRVARPGVRVYADRDYALTRMPKEVEGGALLQRGAGDGGKWLPSGKMTVTQDGTAYAVFRSKYMGKVTLDDAAVAKLQGEGWAEVPGGAASTFPAGEGWEWRVLRRPIKKGEEVGVLKSMTWTQPVVFVFK